MKAVNTGLKLDGIRLGDGTDRVETTVLEFLTTLVDRHSLSQPRHARGRDHPMFRTGLPVPTDAELAAVGLLA